MQSDVTQKLQNKLITIREKPVGRSGRFTYLVTGSPQMTPPEHKIQIHALVKLYITTHY